MENKKVYEAINKVMAALAKIGISKNNRNQQQGYAFRGIDEVYNTLAPILSEHHLCILPKILTRTVTERTTSKGGALFNVVVEAEFCFVCSDDGSSHMVKTFGEAMDSADKATNKAMSAAYKYACLQTFCIPTEGDNDADATTHTVATKKQAANLVIKKEHLQKINAALTEEALNNAIKEIKEDLGDNFAKFRDNFVTHYKRRLAEINETKQGEAKNEQQPN